jgi:hypothetical protein
MNYFGVLMCGRCPAALSSASGGAAAQLLKTLCTYRYSSSQTGASAIIQYTFTSLTKT